VEFAMHEGLRKTAFSGGRASCPDCDSPMIAKCGPRVIHHWAHSGRRNCDPWWENETPWHREWKSRFPEHFREVSHTAPDGEIHRADLKTQNGIVIEVQHSAMTDAERLSREAFYRNLVWIIDGRPFERNFAVLEKLPDPNSDLGRDPVWYKSTHNRVGLRRIPAFGLCWSLSKNRVDRPELSKLNLGKPGSLVQICNFEERLRMEKQLDALYRGHHQYDWIRPRQIWLDAKCPVFIDFGSTVLLKLEIYDETGLKCVRRVSKDQFVLDAMQFSSAADVGGLSRETS
jgi:competence protein CoiA